MFHAAWQKISLLLIGSFLTLMALMVCSSRESGGSQSDAGALTARPVSADAAGGGRLGTIQDEISMSRQNAITRAVMEVSPTVVGINVTQVQRVVQQNPFADDPFFRNFFQPVPIERRVKSLGSGFIISKDGHILTNQHVVDQAKEIIVTRVGGKQYVAKKIGEDYTTDLAILKIEGKDFPYAHFGDSDDVIIGEWAIALGNPLGLFDISSKPIVTVGVISGTDQDFGRQESDRVFEDMLQTDAAINGGNSGGPLVNCNGEVIGINTWIISGSEMMSANIGLAFAIPINRVKRLLADLINYGQVDRTYWTGIQYEALTPQVARYLGLKSRDGAIISEVKEGSPAEKSGLQIGDVIISIAGKEVNTFEDVRNITENLDLKKGDTLDFRVFRDRRFINVSLVLESHPDAYKRKAR